ncbi:enterobactin exporter EntS [compost metagenome]
MTFNKLFEYWKYPSILLFGIGVTNIAAWIYFIALNLIVLNMTHSPFAVSGLYILNPLATLFTNLWSGSLIDRVNKRNLMAFLDVFRAILISVLPLFSSIWCIYLIVLIINMASSIFGPTSMTYTTKLIPADRRQRFNSLNSLINSGAFLIGPAVAGMLFFIGSPTFAIEINSVSLSISALITLIMPNLDKTSSYYVRDKKITLKLLKKDLSLVFQFYRRYTYFMIICFLFGGVIVVMTSAVDSLEVSFAKLVLHLSERDYGILVSIAGAGIIVGAIINTLIVKKLAITVMIGVGSLGVCFGYLIYAFSNSFFIAAVGFFNLAFCLAFVNTGFITFFQYNVPIELMGRVRSLNEFIEAILKIITIVILGFAAEQISVRFAVIAGVTVILLLGITLCVCVMRPSKTNFFQLTSPSKKE